MAGWTASAAQDPAQAWRDANQAVAQFPRGHADVLKWEQGHPQPPSDASAPAESTASSLALGSADEAVRLAWQAHRDLARPLARLGEADTALVASGRWLALDPALRQRIEGLDEVLEVAALTRQAWVRAVASQQLLDPLQQAQHAAETAAELGQRMVAAGNWSALQQNQVLLARSNARMAQLRAEYAAAQARNALLQAVQGQGRYSTVIVPATLPAAKAADEAWTPSAFEQHLGKAQSYWAWGDRANQTAKVRLLYAAYQTSQAVARIQRDEVLPQHESIMNETVLHYNGMLKSTWDLLNEAQALAEAQAEAINAQRDAELALIDLQWALLGGGPAEPIALGGSNSATPARQGH